MLVEYGRDCTAMFRGVPRDVEPGGFSGDGFAGRVVGDEYQLVLHHSAPPMFRQMD